MILKRYGSAFFYEVKARDLSDKAGYLIEFYGALNLESSGLEVVRFGDLTGFEVGYLPYVTGVVKTVDLDNEEQAGDVRHYVISAIKRLREDLKEVKSIQALEESQQLALTFICNYCKMSMRDVLMFIAE